MDEENKNYDPAKFPDGLSALRKYIKEKNDRAADDKRHFEEFKIPYLYILMAYSSS